MRKLVILTNLEDKPKDCTVCPLLNEYDECQALPWHRTNWDEQYTNCPLKVIGVRSKEERDGVH